ncbi:uncharacterized protein LOC124169779 isoform X4 [Ischnura elegans]|uniref:uncharacterized protein LOC124169779 isoform X4 n=1 Tax=Ischnura elegans TaxID=197161 RepID=UPI001ED8A67D|nr:uncharacterized protein LOC124169779 isoform X4 [Ischnura elegans]
MARLTEEMVIARSRASDLASIKKLNCWGSDLSDITLLRRMLSVEVLSLSVNKINSLADFQYCRNLQELYVRKNEIRDLNEVCYLQELPNLKCLWLADNPCADVNLYRPTVLKALPRLQKLDNVAVEPEEVQDAMRRGLDLYHPEEQQPPTPSEYESTNTPRRKAVNHSPQASPSDSPQGSPEQCWTLRPETPVHHHQQSPSNGHERSPPRRLQRQSSERDMEISEGTIRRGPSGFCPTTPNDDDLAYYDNDRRNANNCEQPEYGYGRQVTSYSSSYDIPAQCGFQGEEEQQHYERVCRQQMQQSQHQRPTGLHLQSSGKPPSSRSNAGRPKTRSNVLSAILCLLKELDYPSLEVVEMAVRSRMDEFED